MPHSQRVGSFVPQSFHRWGGLVACADVLSPGAGITCQQLTGCMMLCVVADVGQVCGPCGRHSIQPGVHCRCSVGGGWRAVHLADALLLWVLAPSWYTACTIAGRAQTPSPVFIRGCIVPHSMPHSRDTISCQAVAGPDVHMHDTATANTTVGKAAVACLNGTHRRLCQEPTSGGSTTLAFAGCKRSCRRCRNSHCAL
jgi:hypothetical protein